MCVVLEKAKLRRPSDKDRPVVTRGREQERVGLQSGERQGPWGLTVWYVRDTVHLPTLKRTVCGKTQWCCSILESTGFLKMYSENRSPLLSVCYNASYYTSAMETVSLNDILYDKRGRR